VQALGSKVCFFDSPSRCTVTINSSVVASFQPSRFKKRHISHRQAVLNSVTAEASLGLPACGCPCAEEKDFEEHKSRNNARRYFPTKRH